MALTHEYMTLGADKDEFTLLERAIAKKFSHWHRDSAGRSMSSSSSGGGSQSYTSTQQVSSKTSNQSNYGSKKKQTSKKDSQSSSNTNATVMETQAGSTALDMSIDPLQNFPQDGEGGMDLFAGDGTGGELDDFQLFDDLGFD